jgi:hypothetical protein
MLSSHNGLVLVVRFILWRIPMKMFRPRVSHVLTAPVFIIVTASLKKHVRRMFVSGVWPLGYSSFFISIHFSFFVRKVRLTISYVCVCLYMFVQMVVCPCFRPSACICRVEQTYLCVDPWRVKNQGQWDFFFKFFNIHSPSLDFSTQMSVLYGLMEKKSAITLSFPNLCTILSKRTEQTWLMDTLHYSEGRSSF